MSWLSWLRLPRLRLARLPGMRRLWRLRLLRTLGKVPHLLGLGLPAKATKTPASNSPAFRY
jgi:hypothetical protein